MIIVNSPGSGATAFAPLLHADWHGFTPTDLVFPSFLFAVGNAMSFSFEKLQQLNHSAFLLKILKRTVLIFLLGFLLYWYPFFAFAEDGSLYLKPLSETRIMGVLQRIALCYLFASLMIRYFSTRAVLVLSMVLLAGYWLILLLFAGDADPYNMTGNTGSFIDRIILGEKHLYHGEGVAFEPEGLLSTLPAIVNVIAGFYTGMFIKKQGRNYETVAMLLLAGALMIVIALAWNMTFPVNKKLWTSSFVLLTSGIDLAIIAALIYIIELRGSNEGNWTKFFTIFGKNPLFIYLFSELLLITLFLINVNPGQNFYNWINQVLFQRVAPGAFGSLIFAVVFMLVCWLMGWWLERKKIYIRV